MIHSEISVRNFWPTRKRARAAGAIVVIAMTLIAIGVAGKFYRWWSGNVLQARIVNGEPAVIRFICGVDSVVDCRTTVRIIYRKQPSGWCEYLERSDGDAGVRTQWCVGNPEMGTLSILGVIHSFDRYGAVRKDDRLVGQMFLP